MSSVLALGWSPGAPQSARALALARATADAAHPQPTRQGGPRSPAPGHNA
jgi:hypothetical protein